MRLWIAPIYVKISIRKVTVTKLRNVPISRMRMANLESLAGISRITSIGVH
jgi:hypothetical protein